MKAAERLARQQWFDFELAPLVERLGGDWVRIVAEMQAGEERLSREWRPRMRASEAPLSAAQTRARRVLEQEFDQVARARGDEIRALARRVIVTLQKGDVDDLVMFDGRELNRNFLHEQRPALHEAARLADPEAADFASQLDFEPPQPGRGMVGRVSIPFGPLTPRPRGHEQAYPSHHQIALWWSGQVMPEPNGPLHSAPPPPGETLIRWRFWALVTPYSQVPRMLL